jgi:hypothetical protein
MTKPNLTARFGRQQLTHDKTIIYPLDNTPAQPGALRYTIDTPEVINLMKLYGFHHPVCDGTGVWYVVRPDWRFFYALTASSQSGSTLERWKEHLINCLEDL